MSRPVITRAVLAVAGLAFLATFAVGADEPDYELLVNLTVAGIAAGGIYALAGMGLVITYKATGVFNFAYGAIGMFVAFLLWQMSAQWGWSMWIAAPLALLVLAPLLGYLLDIVVFRPLERREASVAEELVATIGIFVVLVGTAVAIWTGQTREAPRLFSADALVWQLPFSTGGEPIDVRIGTDQLAILAVAVVFSILLAVVFRYTSFGTEVRAVVDRRELAQLSSIDADRISSVSWAIGSVLAGLTGVVLAPSTFGLDAVRLPLVVIETFAVAVIARLVSLPLAVAGGVYLGIAVAYGSNFHFGEIARVLGASDRAIGVLTSAIDPVMVNLSAFVLFGALILNRKLDVVGDEGGGSLVARSTIAAKRAASHLNRRSVAGIALLLLVLPLGLDFATFSYAHRMLALAIVFLSIVAVTGFSGHITLGQAGFAGLGAFLTARIAAGTFLGLPELPIAVAMIIAAIACIPVGFLAGYPALKRRGLFLGLTTLAVGLVLSRYVFQNFYFNAPSVMKMGRPTPFASDTAFYYYELAILGLAIVLTHNLRSGRLGRILGAMRDSETASWSIGLNLRRYKLFIFSASAFMAGLGGSLLTQSAGAFSIETYVAFYSLLWFAAVVVAGVTSIYGALLGAFLLTMLDVVVQRPGVSFFIIGVSAVLLGRLPGGLVGLVRRVTVAGWVPAGLRREYVTATSPPPPIEATVYTPSPFALRVMAEQRSTNGERTTAGPVEGRA